MDESDYFELQSILDNEERRPSGKVVFTRARNTGLPELYIYADSVDHLLKDQIFIDASEMYGIRLYYSAERRAIMWYRVTSPDKQYIYGYVNER